MTKIDKEGLEKAFNKSEEQKGLQMTKDQEIAFHQGALNTLVNERNELFKMVQNVEMVMQAHLKRLEELGVKIQTKRE